MKPRSLASLLLLAVTVSTAGCPSIIDPPEEPPGFGEAELTALFIGNSLTASNDLPGTVAAIAEAAGRDFEHRTVVRSGAALEDHWNRGVATTIEALGADVVVLQQGPSSLPENQAHLTRWTRTFAPVVRDAGGEPALLMVWPESTRMEAFDAVRRSYRAAAEAVDGIFIPAGEAWRAVWARDSDAPLYGGDGFHPGTHGTFVAALTVYAVLFEADPRDLPPLLSSAEESMLYYEAVHATVEEWSGREER